MLVLDDVSFAYDDVGLARKRRRHAKPTSQTGTEHETYVLKHLNLTIETGEFLCLVGHSGCGKTTLLRILAGLAAPSSGSVAIDGRPLEGPGLNRSVVFQSYSLFPWMSALQNIEFGVSQANTELHRGLSRVQIEEVSREYLTRVDMAKAANLKPYQLSGGMRQRVAIARALAMDAETLLFDEPFAALDVRTRRELQLLMQRLWTDGGKPRTAVFVTHDIEEALLLADRIVFMSGGRFLDDFAQPAKRPRDPETFPRTDEFESMRARLLNLFYSAEETKRDRSDLERIHDEPVMA